jgi:hypothetical protein
VRRSVAAFSREFEKMPRPGSDDGRWKSKFARFIKSYGVESLALQLDVQASAIYHWVRGVSAPRRTHAEIIDGRDLRTCPRGSSGRNRAGDGDAIESRGGDAFGALKSEGTCGQWVSFR